VVEERAEGEDAEEGAKEHDGKVERCLCEGREVGDDALAGVILFVRQALEPAASASVFILLY
jgi:hypothetical protein